MKAENLQALPPPPGIIASLKAGFDAIAANIALIILPLGLDILLWFGPRLRVHKLFGPFLVSFTQRVAVSDFPAEQIKAMQFSVEEFLTLLQDFNLISIMRTFPIGVFSLMSGAIPTGTPLGTPDSFQIETGLTFIFWVGLLIFAGWVAGGLFFYWVANTISHSDETEKLNIAQAIFQTILLSLLWIVILFVLGMPVMLVLSIFEIISPVLAQGLLLIFFILSMWLLVPFFFMPHGIFIKQQNAFVSIYSSLRMARYTLPASSLFVFSIVLIGFGMNFLWAIPDSDSWMALIGITGHAFVTTSLLAASFIYYRDINAWLQTVLDKVKNAIPAQQV